MSKSIYRAASAHSPTVRHIYHVSQEHPDSNMLIEVTTRHCRCLCNLMPHKSLFLYLSYFYMFLLPFIHILSATFDPFVSFGEEPDAINEF